jgi:hypothetical protein
MHEYPDPRPADHQKIAQYCREFMPGPDREMAKVRIPLFNSREQSANEEMVSGH